jgi:PucR C-terminal helix-turn-helix domain/GGDEF-like domain
VARENAAVPSLRDVLAAVSPEPLRALVVEDPAAAVTEVAIYDAADRGPLAAGQLLLAVGADPTSREAHELVREAGAAGAAGIVLKLDPDRPQAALAEAARQAGVALLAVRPGFAWESLLSVLRSKVAGTEADATSRRLVPGDLFGVAAAIEEMVGGSVVIYDRGHHVLAHSASDDDVDDVRRETILGRRTPEDWVRRFTLDDSAYRTVRTPGQVIRVDGYAGLRTRLRVAVCAGDEILGEISVAEGRRPLGPEAEEALLRAATLTAPHLLRHRLAEVEARTTRWTMLRALLGGTGPIELYASQLGLDPRGSYTVLAVSARTSAAGHDERALEAFHERVLHFISLHVTGFNPRSALLFDGVHVALVPTADDAARARLVQLAQTIVVELDRPDLDVCAAVGDRVEGLGRVAASRGQVDVLLTLGPDEQQSAVVFTSEGRWQQLALHQILAATGESRTEPCAPLVRLLEHDRRHQTDYVRTLRTYLDALGSVSATARRLIVHPNTLRHRLARLTEISGLDLDDSVERIVLDIDLRLLELKQLGEPRHGQA